MLAKKSVKEAMRVGELIEGWGEGESGKRSQRVADADTGRQRREQREQRKSQALIVSLQINPAEAERIGLDLDSVAKLVNNFENPFCPPRLQEKTWQMRQVFSC